MLVLLECSAVTAVDLKEKQFTLMATIEPLMALLIIQRQGSIRMTEVGLVNGTDTSDAFMPLICTREVFRTICRDSETQNSTHFNINNGHATRY